jgi:hypothetical protein
VEAVVDDDYEATRRLAWRCLRKGAIFLTCCVAISKTARAMAFPLHDLIAESVTILGWVALWKPIEMFLYDLPEMRRRRKQAQAAPGAP